MPVLALAGSACGLQHPAFGGFGARRVEPVPVGTPPAGDAGLETSAPETPPEPPPDATAEDVPSEALAVPWDASASDLAPPPDAGLPIVEDHPAPEVSGVLDHPPADRGTLDAGSPDTAPPPSEDAPSVAPEVSVDRPPAGLTDALAVPCEHGPGRSLVLLAFEGTTIRADRWAFACPFGSHVGCGAEHEVGARTPVVAGAPMLGALRVIDGRPTTVILAAPLAGMAPRTLTLHALAWNFWPEVPHVVTATTRATGTRRYPEAVGPLPERWYAFDLTGHLRPEDPPEAPRLELTVEPRDPLDAREARIALRALELCVE